jgi:predicted  nucleic acid-binding Zn-ribbon protein
VAETERLGEIESNLRSAEQEVSDIQERIEAIHNEVKEIALANWQSPWKTPESVEIFVKARMGSRPEYFALVNQLRKAEDRKVQLQGELDALREKTEPAEEPS